MGTMGRVMRVHETAWAAARRRTDNNNYNNNDNNTSSKAKTTTTIPATQTTTITATKATTTGEQTTEKTGERRNKAIWISTLTARKQTVHSATMANVAYAMLAAIRVFLACCDIPPVSVAFFG